MKKYFIFLAILIFFFCFGSFIQAQTSSQEEDRTVVKKTIETVKNSFKDVLVIWKKAHLKIVEYWKGNLLPKIQELYERKKPKIKEEFEKEKEEMTEDIKNNFLKQFSSLWENFKQFTKKLIIKTISTPDSPQEGN